MSDPVQFTKRIGESRARQLAPAIGAVFVSRGGLPRIAAFGRRSAFAREAAGQGDLWHIGSCTKAMTATVLARLAERGLIRFGATLEDALPALAAGMHPGFRRKTLTSVLTHSAGIARDPERSTFAALRRSTAPVRAQRRFLASEALRAVPRPGSGYSNLGYIVLGAVIETILDRSWEEALAREVMAPLGIGRFGFGPPGEVGTLDQPRGHRRVGEDWRVRTAALSGDNPQAYGPAGRVHISLADWSRFLRVHLGAGPRGFLAPGTLRVLHRPAANGFAMGWTAIRDGRAGEMRLRHTGSNTAWYALALLAPLRGCGVGIVCNGFSEAVAEAVDDLARDLMAYRDPDAAP